MKNTIWLKALTSALILSFVVSFGLYYFSDRFFQAKNKQTMIKSAELGTSSDNADVVLPIGKNVPDFELEDVLADVETSKRLLADTKTIKIINFWASWCEPCVEEFSSFARLIKDYEGEISFYGVGQDDSKEESKTFIKAFNSEFAGISNIYFLFDADKAAAKSYGVLALPETFIIDANGKLLKRITGFFDWDQKQVRVFFDRVLSTKGSGL